MNEPVTLTREQLYELVWQKPVSRLAEEYGISNVGLAKICGRAGVPTPPRGYWALLEAGRAPPRPPLPKLPNVPNIRLKPRAAGPAAPEPDPLAVRLAEEKRPENRIVVQERLHAPSELVAAAKTALQGVKEDSIGFVAPPSGCLAIVVSRAQIPRALRVADALLKAAISRGWSARVSQKTTYLTVDAVPISLTIEEGMETTEQPVKPELGDGYSFNYERRNFEKRPSGLLSISIKEDESIYPHTQQRSWNESDKRPIEDSLNSVLAGLIKLAAAVKAHRERKEIEARAEEARRQRVEAALVEQKKLRAAFDAEESRLEELRRQARAWREAKNLRRYVAEGCKRMRGDASTPEGNLERWAEWALAQADRLDPFSPSPPSILDEGDRIEGMVDEARRRA
jgi:hypothetical protein